MLYRYHFLSNFTERNFKARLSKRRCGAAEAAEQSAAARPGDAVQHGRRVQVVSGREYPFGDLVGRIWRRRQGD